MSSPLSLRLAAPGDAPELARVFAAAVMAGARGYYGPGELRAWVAQGSAERFEGMLADPAKTVLAAEVGGVLVGLAGLEGAEVMLLYAAPGAPPGTGCRLLAAVENLARERGRGALTLNASRNALRFYLKRGYRILAPARRLLPGGESLVVCLMVKDLLSPVHEESNPGA